MNYADTTDINLYLWVSWEDNLINLLNRTATSLINSYLWVDELKNTTYTDEEHDFYWNNWIPNNIYYLKQINPTEITSINWKSAWNYKLNGRRLELQYSPINTDTIFNKVKITYKAWFLEIPEDIKMVAYNLVWFMYNNRKWQGINSFTQGQLSVSYSNWEGTYEEIQYILAWLDKYKRNIILS